MGAVWYRARSDLRTRWRSWLGLALLLPAASLIANLVAAVPAWAAARTPPAAVLRAE